MTIRHHILLLMVLVATWFLLSGHYTALLTVLGLLSCAICQAVYHRIRTDTGLTRISLNPLLLIKYIGWLLTVIVKSNIAVISAIVSGRDISPKIFEVETLNLNELGQVIYANSITLTPGTVSTKITEGKIQVHGLLAGAENSLADNRMQAQVQKLVAG